MIEMHRFHIREILITLLVIMAFCLLFVPDGYAAPIANLAALIYCMVILCISVFSKTEETIRDEEILSLREKNKELQEQYDSMFRTMVKAGEKLGAIEDANLLEKRKRGMS